MSKYNISSSVKVFLYLFSLFISCTSTLVQSQEAVDCHDESVQISIYTGTAQCSTSSGDYLSEFYYHSYSPTVTLKTDYIPGQQQRTCLASIPFSHIETLTQEVCNFKPTAFIQVSRLDGSTTAYATIKGSDSDGDIIDYKLYVNDQLQNGVTAQLSGGIGVMFRIRGEVTDNHGYTIIVSKNVTLRYTPENPCGNYHC